MVFLLSLLSNFKTLKNMGNFIPAFSGKMLISEKERFEKRFEKTYQDNKEYFDSFVGDVIVNVSEHSNGIAGFLLPNNPTPVETQKHIRKIQELISITLKG